MTMTDDNTKPSPLVPPPPRARNRGLINVPVPQPNRTSDNLGKANSGLHDMNFKMDIDFHRAFKTAASLKNMAMKELLEASFRCWAEREDDPTITSLLPPSLSSKDR